MTGCYRFTCLFRVTFSGFGGVCYIPRGRSIGGTSSINYMMYVRGNKYDYDNWQAMDVVGWSYDKVLPYFLKSEDAGIDELKGSEFHGGGGPVGVEYPEYSTPLREAYIEAGKELGYRTGDYNGHVQTGIFHPQFTMKNGYRVSSGKAYMEPIRDRKNVHVVRNAFVTKVNFDPEDKTVESVEFEREGNVYEVRADKEVVLAAGVFNSAKILMLSGIGPKEHLETLKIPVVVDSMVGDNLQDQISVPVHFRVEDGAALIRPTFENKEAVELFVRDSKGPLTSVVGFEGLGFFDSKGRTNETLPDVQTVMMSYTPMPGDAPVVIFSSNKLRPKSRGTVRLRSSDPRDPPLIDPKYLSDDSDFNDTVASCLLSLRLAETRALQSFSLRVDTSWTPACSSYKDETDLCECLTENYSHPMYTAGGTAKMAHPREAEKSVVCPLLRVHGVHGLRVVDTSVMPLLTSGDTHAPSILIAEMGADFIKRQWS